MDNQLYFFNVFFCPESTLQQVAVRIYHFGN